MKNAYAFLRILYLSKVTVKYKIKMSNMDKKV